MEPKGYVSTYVCETPNRQSIPIIILFENNTWLDFASELPHQMTVFLEELCA